MMLVTNLQIEKSADATYVRNWDRLCTLPTKILEQVLDENRSLCNLTLDGHVNTLRGGKYDHLLAAIGGRS
jgi:hypothetical protein